MKALWNHILIVPASRIEMNSSLWYVIGVIVALLLLIYLVIALVKPEKF
jgi:K+-transporting ATPase KdpF subunit